MRLLVVSACVAVITTGPALACPRNVMCVVTPELGASAETRAARPEPRAIPDVRTVHLAPDDHLTFGDAPHKRDASEIEMPWIWQMLRDQVYSRMPSYEARDRFTLVLSPVVVTSPSDTIPGVGVAGAF